MAVGGQTSHAGASIVSMDLHLSPGAARYTRTAMLLHWLLALAIVVSFVVGLQMVDMKMSVFRLKLYNWHKWAGICILALSAARLLWRLFHPPPPPPPMRAWQQRVAHATHLLLYALFFATPLLGWAYSSAAGFPVVVFGVLPLPDWVSPGKELAELIKPWHGWAAKAMAVLVLLHVAGALKHQLVDRDGLLRRMWS